MTAVVPPLSKDLQDIPPKANLAWYRDSKAAQGQGQGRVENDISRNTTSTNLTRSPTRTTPSRIPMSRKAIQRTSSASASSPASSSSVSPNPTASSLSSTPSSSTVVVDNHPSAPSSQHAIHPTSQTQPKPHPVGNGLLTMPKKKKMPFSYVFPGPKADPVSTVTKTRSHGISAAPSSTSATSAISALHDPASTSSSSHSSSASSLPAQHSYHPQQSLHQQQHQQQSHLLLQNHHHQAGMRNEVNGQRSLPTPILCLAPVNGTFDRKQITVPYAPEVLRIGRQTNPKTLPTSSNGYFDSKVLSRQHAEVWATPDGRIWIKDIKSSNGTFVNGQRLSLENQESDPHELRDHDTLELGIDIVSDDQKSILHHKVSARVEYAGPSGPSMNVMEMTLGDIDPTANGGLYPQHMAQPLQHIRSRPSSSSSNSSMSSNRTIQNGQAGNINALQQQRQMNYWLSPISIEQVVKRLSSEMKLAKQQAQDLNQTQVFLTSLLSAPKAVESKNGLSEKTPAPTPDGNLPHPNGTSQPPLRPKMSKVSRLSEPPPAPPPSQPLPEKPRLPRTGTSDSIPRRASLRRRDSDMRLSASASASVSNSPARPDTSQMAYLIEALASTKKDLDVQASRVRELEALLEEERKARVAAEAELQKDRTPQTGDADPASSVLSSQEVTSEGSPPSQEPLPPTVNHREQDPEPLKARIDSLLSEMEELKHKMEQYKHTAEEAQREANESKKSLADAVEKLRQTQEEAEAVKAAAAAAADIAENGVAQQSPTSSVEKSQRVRKFFAKSPGKPKTRKPPSRSPRSPRRASSGGGSPTASRGRAKDSEKAKHSPSPPPEETEPAKRTGSVSSRSSFSTAIENSGPYTSMVGVVLIGVGIMAYLNGWGKIPEK